MDANKREWKESGDGANSALIRVHSRLKSI